MSFFSHLGKSSDSYVLQLHIHDVSPLSSCEAMHCVVKRSSKEFHTRMAMGDGRACSWEETIRMISTLYRAKSKDKKAPPFDKKEYTFIVQTDRASKQRSSLSVSANAVANAASASHAAASAAAAQASKSILMAVDIDLAAFAVPEHLGTEVTRSFALKAIKGGGDGGAAASGLTPMLKVTFKVSLVKKGENIPSMSKSALATVDEQHKQQTHMVGLKPNRRSQSISAVSPVQANATIDSYSKLAGDELSPDLTKRPRRVKAGAGKDDNEDEYSDISSREQRRILADEHAEEDENADGSAPAKSVYGDLESNSPQANTSTKTRRSTGKAALDEIKQKAAANAVRSPDGTQSYASGVAEDVMTPPGVSQPAPPPSESDSVSALPPSARRPSALLSPSERKRRSDTQIFTAIMTSELSSPIAGDKPSLSRRASQLNPPQSAPAQPDSPAALVRSPSTKHAGLRVSTSNADIAGSSRKEIRSAAAARPTPATADDGAFTSYTNFGDDDVPSPQQLRQQQRGSSHGALAADAHADDNDDAVAPSSFADRHAELTVDDVLSPFGGHSGAPSRTASTAGSHARLPSMFVTKNTDRNSSTKLFSSTNKNNYSRTADSALVLPKKGSAQDKDKTSSGGRGSFIGNSSGDSQPPSASSARTPQLTAAASFTGPLSFASLSDAAAVKKMTSKRDSAPAAEHERSTSGASRSRHSIDEMLDGNHLATGGHSQHNSRQASRSPSPSRSTGSGGTAGSSVGSSLPSYISGTFLPAASPRQNTKPSFPHSSPAKHSAAHVGSRVNGRSPFSSLSKEESRMLSTGGASASSTMSSTGGSSEAEAEAGSLASYRAALKQKARSSSRSNNSTPYSSLQLPVVADHGVGSASKTLPVRVSSSGGINVAPPSPRSAGSRGLATGSLGRDASAALSRSNPAPITAAEATKLERDFFVRMRASVDLLCDQLQIPDLFDSEQPASAGSASAKDSSPSPAASPNPAANPSGTPLKSMWSSVKARLASPSSNASASGPTAAAARSSGASTPATPSAPPSPAGPQAKSAPADPFFHGVPVWSCLVVRCLHAWDAFAVSTFAATDPSSKSQSSSSPGPDDPSGSITRSASRSWILSAILTHLHKTGLFLCARSAAGQRQNALCFFITQLATLIQLVEGFSRSSVAPAPYPLLDDGPASPSSEAPAAVGPEAHTARYAQALRTPSLPEGFGSWRGMYVVAQLPNESTQRVSEWARVQIKALGAGQGVAGKGAGSAPHPSPAATASNSTLFPYSLSLGVSTYTWFLAHLRALLCTVYQCLLELVLTELEIVDPASILSAVDDPMAETVGYEHTLEQLLATYHKIGDDALRNCMSLPLRTHLFASLFAHLNSALFNAVLSKMNLMNMTTGMRLKVITKSMQEWARGFGDDGHGSADCSMGAAGDKEAARDSALLRVCNSELEMCNQLSLLLLMDKRGLTLDDLSAQCSALTPVSLYHLLLNYLPVSSAAAASAAGAPPSARSSSDLICDSILDELSTYQTDVLSHLAARSSGPGPRVLFPAWRVAGLRSRPLEVSDNDDDEDDAGADCTYGAHLRATSSASGANIQSPFLAPMQRIPLPRSAVAAASAAATVAAGASAKSAASPSRTSLLPLASVPVPAALLHDGSGAFACLQRADQLVLPVTRGASTSQ